jgi:hypothetical protein
LTCDFAEENDERKIAVKAKAMKSVASPLGFARGRAVIRFASARRGAKEGAEKVQCGRERFPRRVKPRWRGRSEGTAEKAAKNSCCAHEEKARG